jgi:hypothetical protein
MNDYCIIFSKQDNDIFLHFWKKFELFSNQLKSINIRNEEDCIRLCFSIKKSVKSILDQIKITLAETIVLNYKYKFMVNNLQLPDSFKEYKDALCKSLAVFDRTSDILEVVSLLNFTSSINIDSFYIFKLSNLRTKWKEVTDLFLENMANILYSNSFIELIRYLIMTTESDGVEVFVYKYNNTIYLRNKDGINLSDPIKVGENYLPEVVCELIMLAPLNIYLKYDRDKTKELTELIIDLFAEKVVVNT